MSAYICCFECSWAKPSDDESASGRALALVGSRCFHSRTFEYAFLVPPTLTVGSRGYELVRSSALKPVSSIITEALNEKATRAAGVAKDGAVFCCNTARRMY